MKSSWSVIVIYEDNVAREKAVEFCEGLTRRFWTTYSFEISWWSYAELHEEKRMKEASGKAAGADVVVMATGPDAYVPLGMRAWIETWVEQRGDREGTLVALGDPGVEFEGEASQRFAYLRSVAHRAGMDYLNHVPSSLARPVPDSLDSFSERAERITGVLDEILHRPAAPPSTYR